MSGSDIQSQETYDKLKSKVLLQCLLLSLVISLSPFKILSYGIPVLLLIFVLLRYFSKIIYKKIFFSTLLILLLFLFYHFKNSFLGYSFGFVSGILSIITYGSILFVLVFPKFISSLESPETQLLNKIIYIVFVVETVVVLIQLVCTFLFLTSSFDEATGDLVQGTINIFSFINQEVGFNNQVFTVNYIFLLLYLLPYLIKANKKYFIYIGVLIILFASVLHVVFSFFLALISCVLVIGFIKFRRQIFRFFIGGVLVTLVLYLTQPKNFSLINYYFTSLTALQSPKVLIVANTIAFLPEEYPDALFLGLGPGQYTSRASLITSGRYFGDFEKPTRLPLLDGTSSSKPFRDYVFDIWESYATNAELYGNSTMSRPFFSLFSLVVEFGIIFFIGFFILMIRFILKCRKRYEKVSKDNKILSYYSLANIISILFIFYLGFFENYLESSASICSGLILVKYFNNVK